MDGTMSQEEINALLNNPSGTDENPENTLTERKKMRSERSQYQYGNGSDHAVFSGKPKSRDLHSSCCFRKLE